MNVLSEKRAFGALSSASRLEILELLYRKPLSVEEIAESVKLKPITVRHHLQQLEDAGFIESYEEKGHGVGRPKTYYHIAKEPVSVNFPKRRYLVLSDFLVRTARLLLGRKRGDAFLRKVGRNMGEDVIRKLESSHNIKEWSFEAFKDYYVKGYNAEAGEEPEIAQTGDNLIVYRTHNCLFLELAMKMPDTVCDVLHDAFHEGIGDALGGKVKITRVTCKGHGAPYCEHRCEWRTSIS